MRTTVFPEMEFWLLVALSGVLPAVIYGALLVKRAISRTTVLIFGIALVGIAGVDVYLLQKLATAAKQSSSLADDFIFVSEVSLGLYLLPALFGGIGVNLVSHVLIRHLVAAEKQFEQEHPNVRP
jgi:hypothetical protein